MKQERRAPAAGAGGGTIAFIPCVTMVIELRFVDAGRRGRTEIGPPGNHCRIREYINMLKNIASMSLLLCVMIAVGGCGDPPKEEKPKAAPDTLESVMKDSLACTGNLVKILGTIKDKATAEAAADDVKSALDTMKKISVRQKKFQAKFDAMSAEEKGKFMESMQPLMKEVERLRAIPEAKQVLEDIRKAMSE